MQAPPKLVSAPEAKVPESVPAPAAVPAATTEAKPPESKAAAEASPKKPATVEERLVMGDEYEKTVAGLMDMGFGREQVVKALKAAFNNPERAAEYLINVNVLLLTSIREFQLD